MSSSLPVWHRRANVQTVVILVALAVAVAVAHGGALRGEFHYDDQFLVVENPDVQHWRPMRYFWTAHAPTGGREMGAGGYRPLTIASLALNYQAGGLDPWGYLLVNVTLHGVVSWLVFLLGRQLLNDTGWGAVAGLVFAIHPMNAEAVNYVTARSSLLSVLFSLVAFWALLRHAQRAKGVAWAAGCLAAFGAAMLSKESAVTLVIPMAALWWLAPRLEGGSGFRLDTAGRRRVGRVAGLCAIAAIVYVVWWNLMATGDAQSSLAAERPLWTVLEIFGRSLLLWVWPWPLGLERPLTFLVRFEPWLATVLVGAAVGLVVAFTGAIKRAPFAAWAISWAAAGLAPLAPLPWLTTVALFQEHRVGMAAVALSWLTAATMAWIWRHVPQREPLPWVMRSGVVAAGAVVALGAVGVDRARAAVWNDDRRLWEEVVRRSPENPLARMNLGSAYMKRGDLDRAEAEFRAMTQVDPGYSRAYYNLGLVALQRLDRDEEKGVDPRRRLIEAREAFRQATAISPREANAHAAMGRVQLLLGDDAGAERSLRTALSVDPTHRFALDHLANLYVVRRDWPSAMDVLTQVLEQDPGSLSAAYLRGVALMALDRRSEGEAVLREVLARLPEEPQFGQYRVGIARLLEGGQP